LRSFHWLAGRLKDREAVDRKTRNEDDDKDTYGNRRPASDQR
jgi:hypothetical protein